jgi:hypothetical protein
MYLGVPFYALMDFDYLFKNKNTKKKKNSYGHYNKEINRWNFRTSFVFPEMSWYMERRLLHSGLSGLSNSMLKKSPENRHNKELRLEKIRTSIDGTISTMQSIKRVDNSWDRKCKD